MTATSSGIVCRMATLRDIARQVDVSVSTVSRALTGHPYVREDLRKRVLDVARELDYRPNALAQGLRRNQTRTVGLIVPDIQNVSHASVTAVLQSLLQRFGYGLALYVSNNDVDTERRCFEKLREQRVDALAYVPCSRSRKYTLSTDGRQVPMVELFRPSGLNDVDTVIYDDDNGADLAISHLLELGHRNIGVVAGPKGYSSTQRRLKGARAAVERASVPADVLSVVHADYTPEGGREGYAKLLVDGARPTAVFAASSQLVLGVLVGCREHGVRIPDDMSVIGFGDPVWYEITDPPITSYAAPITELGMTAGQLLVSRMEGTRDGVHPAKVVLSGHLVVRSSTAGPRSERGSRRS